jgi:hypothetical protein
LESETETLLVLNVLSIISVVRFEVLIAVVMIITILWDMTPCSQLKTTDVSEKHIASIFRSLLATYFQSGCLLGLFFDPEDGGYIFLRNVG